MIDIERKKTLWQKFKASWNPIKITNVNCVHCGSRTGRFIDVNWNLLCFDVGELGILLYITLKLMGI